MDRVFVLVRDHNTGQPVALELDPSGRLPVAIDAPIALSFNDDNPLPVLNRATDGLGNYWDLDVDHAMMALATILHEHHKIHEGDHFFVAGYQTLASGAKVEFVVTVPDTAHWPHMRFIWACSNILTVEMYEGTSGVVGGTPATPFNSHRNYGTASVLTVVKDPASIASDGSLIWAGSWGSRQVGGGGGRDDEIVLKQDTTYLWRATSGANSNIVAYEGLWYEHTDKA